MMPDPDATPAPPEPASAPAALPEKDLRAVETAIAGAAALLIGRVLLGRAGGLAAGLAALGAGLLGKRPPPAVAKEETPEPSSNGHAPAPDAAVPASPFMQVRLQTSPVPPVDAVAALAAATAYAPMSLVAAPPVEEVVELEKTVEPGAVVTPVFEEVEQPPAAPEAVSESGPTTDAPIIYTAPDAASLEDAGAFAEMPALFGPVKEPTAPVPVPLAAILEQTAQDLAAAPVPQTSPVPSLKTTPVPGLLDELPVQFMELREEQEPGPRDGFLLIPEEAPRPLAALESVVAALGAWPPELPDFPDPNQRELDLLAGPESVAPPAAAAAPVLPFIETEAPAAAELSVEMPEPAIVEEPAAESPPWSVPIFPAAESDTAPVPKAITAPVAEFAATLEPTPSTAPVPQLPALPPLPPAFTPAAAEEPPVPATTPVSLPVSATAPVLLPEPATAPVSLPASETAPVSLPAPATAPIPLPTSATAPVDPPVRATAPVRPIPLHDLPPEVTVALAAPVPGTAPVRPIPLPSPATAPVAEMPALPPLPVTLEEETPPEPQVQTAPVLPPVSPLPEPDAPVVESPFRIWQASSPLPESAAPPPPAGPPADPDEIWRQAAAELAAVRAVPAASPAPLAFPPSVPAPGAALPAPFPAVFPAAAAAPAFPEKISLPAAALPAAPAASPPPWLSQGPAVPVADTPPWLKNTTAPPQPKPEAKPFLPTIRLAVPQGPQPLASRRPIAATAGVPPAPVALPGYRAEAVPPILPDAPTGDPVLDIDAPLPAPAPVAAEPPLPAAAALPPVPPFIPAAAPPAADKVFVERRKSSRVTAPAAYKRRLVSPIAVVAIAVASAAALGLAFKPQLVKIWDEKILGKRPAAEDPSLPRPAPPSPPDKPSGVPGDGSDVVIAPDPPKRPPPSPAPAPAPTPSPAPAPEPPPPAAAEPAPAPESTPIDAEPLPTPPPPTSDNPDAPITISEAGAKELINRLLYATSAARVKPLILDTAKLGPAVEAYFSAGKAVPVATHTANLDRTDKIPGTSRMAWSFRVITDSIPGGFPLLIEETPDGLRTDWEFFRQCRDQELQKFAADKAAAPGLYYTGLQRRHVFPDMLPGEDHTQFFGFALASPILSDRSFFAYIPKTSPLAARADTLYKFGGLPYAPVLELAHKNGRIEITGIVRENWRTAAKK